jgi:transposase, IS5 family
MRASRRCAWGCRRSWRRSTGCWTIRPFFAPFRGHFHATLGRPSVPIETYLRLMFLKYRYRLGFERLCREVADSISWQRFCRVPLGVAVPHPTTLMKITTRCGSSAVDGLNEALLAKAVAAKVLKTNRVRADTTVVEANIAYPSDSSLLAKGVAKMAATAKKLQAMGLATRTKMADRTRSVRSRARSINANLKRRNDDKLARSGGSTTSWPISPTGSPARPTRWCGTRRANCALRAPRPTARRPP